MPETMPEPFRLFRDYTAELGTQADPGPAFLVCIDPTADPTAWPFPLVYSAVMLFEALPATFTFDELEKEGERQGLSAGRTVEHLRTWDGLRMVEIEGERICKTGQKPYF